MGEVDSRQSTAKSRFAFLVYLAAARALGTSFGRGARRLACSVAFTIHLGQLIGVDLLDRLPHALELLCAGLDHQEVFPVLADSSLPSVDRMDVGKKVDAGRLAVANERVSDVERLLLGAGGGHDHHQVLGAHEEIPRLERGEVKRSAIS